ncbi:MAG: DUF559 domain-containing protein [Bacteroidetes bacterium]|nr:DUF559 domain-containing protein [Bacteroidota bacterium]MBU1678891.1 DUF559 domain-containing protein [Bacteroidota bacterium]
MKRKIIPYNPNLKEKARELRNNSTTSEIRLWKLLKGRQMCGFDFHRQKPIDKYIVDFFCSELMLAIEIDGISHLGKEKYDAYRQKRLEELGVIFLRFDDNDVYYKLPEVIKTIEKWITKNKMIILN